MHQYYFDKNVWVGSAGIPRKTPDLQARLEWLIELQSHD